MILKPYCAAMGKTRRLMCLGWEKQQASSEDDEVVNVAKRYAYGGILMRTRSRSASPQRSKKENLAPRASEMLESMPRPSHVARVYKHTYKHKRFHRSVKNSYLTPCYGCADRVSKQ